MDADEDSDDNEAVKRRAPRDRACMRVRRKVSSIFREHGPYNVRRAYRMTESAFWELHALLEPHMRSIRAKTGGWQKKHRNGGKNGLISCDIRLPAAGHEVLCQRTS
jgi:hypothetical protein